jgi:hypothetical protein
MMLKWANVLNLAKAGNQAPDRKVVKTDAEGHAQLSDEGYHVTRGNPYRTLIAELRFMNSILRSAQILIGTRPLS